MDKIWEWFGLVARHIHLKLVREFVNANGQQHKTNNIPQLRSAKTRLTSLSINWMQELVCSTNLILCVTILMCNNIVMHGNNKILISHKTLPCSIQKQQIWNNNNNVLSIM